MTFRLSIFVLWTANQFVHLTHLFSGEYNQGGRAGTEACAVLQSSWFCCLALLRRCINCHSLSCHRHVILCQRCSCTLPSQHRNEAGSSRAVSTLGWCSCLLQWSWTGALGTRKAPETFRLKAAGFPCTAYRGQCACLLVTAKATHTICVRHGPKSVEIHDNVFIDQLGFCLSQVASILTVKPKWYLVCVWKRSGPQWCAMFWMVLFTHVNWMLLLAPALTCSNTSCRQHSALVSSKEKWTSGYKLLVQLEEPGCWQKGSVGPLSLCPCADHSHEAPVAWFTGHHQDKNLTSWETLLLEDGEVRNKQLWLLWSHVSLVFSNPFPLLRLQGLQVKFKKQWGCTSKWKRVLVDVIWWYQSSENKACHCKGTIFIQGKLSFFVLVRA